MNVLSLFDGISCAKVSLERAGIPIKTYFASEIDKHAIAVSQKNHPDIVRLGDVREITDLPVPIDLLIGGSPCQDLSIAKKDRKGLDGDRSGLFWQYVRLWKALQPRWFVLENVASMPKKDRDTISKELGVEPVLFDASLVSAQSRKRLFWTNIKFELPADRGILLKDILQPDAEVDPAMVVNGKAFCLTATYHKTGEGQAEYEHNKEKKQRTMVYLTKRQEANGTTLVRVEGISKSVILNDHPLQVLKEGRTELGKQSRKEIREQTGRDSSARSSEHKAYFGRDGTKANCLTTHLGAEGLIVKENLIRKLTPIECERLQGLPDEYTSGIAKTNRYKCLGNAFNVDVVSHILAPLQGHTSAANTDPQHQASNSSTASTSTG